MLIVGLAAGAAIYLFAEDEQSATSYVIVGDTTYPVDPSSAKAYVRQLERGVTIAWLSVSTDT